MSLLKITSSLSLPEREIQITAIRAQGAGGQNVNKVASAIHLRFDIHGSSLPPPIKQRLLNLHDSRITADGIIIIKAQQFRSQEQNKEDALTRLAALLQRATKTAKRRKPTKPSKAARGRRIDAKTRKGNIKKLRKKVQ